MDESCIICHDTNESLIEYIHSCGKYLVHQNCIDTWNNEYDTCFICRKNDNNLNNLNNLNSQEVPVSIIIQTNPYPNPYPNRYNRYTLLYIILGLISTFAVIVLIMAFVLSYA